MQRWPSACNMFHYTPTPLRKRRNWIRIKIAAHNRQTAHCIVERKFGTHSMRCNLKFRVSTCRVNPPSLATLIKSRMNMNERRVRRRFGTFAVSSFERASAFNASTFLRAAAVHRKQRKSSGLPRGTRVRQLRRVQRAGKQQAARACIGGVPTSCKQLLP